MGFNSIFHNKDRLDNDACPNPSPQHKFNLPCPNKFLQSSRAMHKHLFAAQQEACNTGLLKGSTKESFMRPRKALFKLCTRCFIDNFLTRKRLAFMQRQKQETVPLDSPTCDFLLFTIHYACGFLLLTIHYECGFLLFTIYYEYQTFCTQSCQQLQTIKSS